MPTSIDPQPGDNEIECGGCGAYFYYELTRCPKCGVNVYEPDDETHPDDPRRTRQASSRGPGMLDRLGGFFKQLTGQPDPADELFGASINQAQLFNNLLLKVGGDRFTVERLVAYEREQLPQGNRLIWLENAIQRWEQDNRGPGVE